MELSDENCKLWTAVKSGEWSKVKEMLQEYPHTCMEVQQGLLTRLFAEKEWDILNNILQLNLFKDYSPYIARLLFENERWHSYFQLLTKEMSVMDLETMASLPFKGTLSLGQLTTYVHELLHFSQDKCYDMALFELLDLTLVHLLQHGPTHFELAKDMIAALGDPSTKLMFYTVFYKTGRCAHIKRLSTSHMISMQSLDQFLTSLWSDSRPACSFFAFLMAAQWERWETVKDMIESGGRDKLLWQSDTLSVVHKLFQLGGEKLEIAALLLQSLLCSLEFGKNDASRLPSKACLDSLRDKLVDYNYQSFPGCDLRQFELVCKELELNGLATLIGLWRVQPGDVVIGAEFSLEKDIDSNTAEIILKELIKKYEWNLVLKLVRRHPELETFVVEHVACRMGKGTGAKAVIKKFVGNVKDIRVLQFLLFNIVGRSVDPDLFQLVLAKNLLKPTFITLTPDRPGLAPTLTTVTHTYIKCRRNVRDTDPSVLKRRRQTVKKAYRILRLCIEAGLSTQQDSSTVTSPCQFSHPLSQAVFAGMLDLVDLLYQTGATCSVELHRLLTCPEPGIYDEEESREDLTEVFKYVRCAVSIPRSLRDLCRLQLSRITGCRADRKHRALSLGLPLQLTRLILFYDVLDKTDAKLDQ